MRRIWLSIVSLVYVGMVFLCRSRLRAHAEKNSGAIEEIRSNRKPKGIALISSTRPGSRCEFPSLRCLPLAQQCDSRCGDCLSGVSKKPANDF
jgi:hypothetical protein